MEPRRDGPGRPFEEYYTQTPTHLWQYDLESGSLEEICNRDRIAPFTTPALLLSDERLLIQPDLDHFNRDFKPELSRGGSQICCLDPKSGLITPLTPRNESVWDFRASQSPNGKEVVFCRAATGEAPAIWVMDNDGNNARMVTRGIDELGADHPRWVETHAAK